MSQSQSLGAAKYASMEPANKRAEEVGSQTTLVLIPGTHMVKGKK